MKVTCLKNGPILIDLELVEVTNETGNKESKTGPVALCRCGHSANKPFCDGKHKVIGFEADLVELNE